MSPTKTVYSFDPHTGAYLRAIVLDEGDLSPADRAEGNLVWLIPGNCMESEPPVAPAGKYARVEQGAWVLRDIPPPPEPVEPTEPPAPAEPPELTIEQRAELLLEVVDSYMDVQAKAAGYKSGLVGAITYADEKAVPQYWAEGRMFRKWRSLVYAKCYALLAQVVAGEIEEPTAETLMPMLPVLDWVTCKTEKEALEAEQAAAAAAVAAAHEQDDGAAETGAPE